MIKRRFLIALAVGFLASFSVRASHAYGGEITWKCFSAGPNAGKYKFYLNLYRDCGSGNASLPGGSVVLNSNSPAGSIVLTQIGSNTDVSPSCYVSPSPIRCNVSASGQGALEEARYESAFITLNGTPPATGWTFDYSLCCRPSSLTNLVNPGSTNLFLRAVMYPFTANGVVQNTSSCYDSSPKFLESPKSVTCTGSRFKYTQLAFDENLDSTHFEWSPPLTASASPISFASPYSVANQLPGGTTPAYINPKTGAINFLPSAGGSFATAIKVSSYRCGQLISEVYRDIPLAINSSCPTLPSGASNKAPSLILSAPSGYPSLVPSVQNGDTTHYELTVMAGQSVKILIQSADSEILPNFLPQSIAFSSLGGNVDATLTSTSGCMAPPCAAITPAFPQTGFVNPLSNAVEFNWQTNCGHVPQTLGCPKDEAVYVVAFRMTDNFCPIPSTRLKEVRIRVVRSKPTPPVTSSAWANTLPNGNILLNWSAPLDTGTAFRGYAIYHASTSSGPFVGIDTVLAYTTHSYTHSSPSSGVNYYQIRSLGSCDQQSEPSDTLKTIWLTDTRPNANDSSVVQLSWNRPRPGFAQYYSIWRSPTGANVWTKVDSTLALSYRDSIGDCRSVLDYKVLATGGGISSVRALNMGDNTNFGTHSIDSSLVTANSVWFSWEQDSIQDVNDYVVVAQEPGGAWVDLDTVAGSVLNYSITPRPLLTKEYRVYSIDSCGNPSSFLTSTGIVVNGTIGTEESAIQNLNLSPNPTKGWVTWSIPLEGTFEVRTLDGKALLSGQLPDPIDLSDIPNGPIVVVVFSRLGTKSFTLLKAN